MAVGENARPPATHKLTHGSVLGLLRLCLRGVRLVFRAPPFAADPHAAAFGGRAVVVVLLVARLFAKGADFLAEPVGPVHHGADLIPRTARARRPEAHAPMAVCLVLLGWASDAIADALRQAAPLAQPPVALYAGQQHRGNRRMLATAWQVAFSQIATIANLRLVSFWEYACNAKMQTLAITIRATAATRPALCAQGVLRDAALLALAH